MSSSALLRHPHLLIARSRIHLGAMRLGATGTPSASALVLSPLLASAMMRPGAEAFVVAAPSAAPSGPYVRPFARARPAPGALALGAGRAITMPPLPSIGEHLPLARECMDYLDACPDPYHVVQTSAGILADYGFVELDEAAPWSAQIAPGGRYYFTRNRSTIVAFSVGEKYVPGNGFKIIGGHTDSPNLKVKPRSKRTSSGVTQLAVECYGGGLWHTWFDRDLGLSGRAMVCGGRGGGEDGDNRIEQRLVRIDRPLVRVPNLAIHLQTAKEREAFTVNKEDHLQPILAMEAEKALGGTGEGDDGDDGDDCDDCDDGDKDGERNEAENKSGQETATKDGWTEYQEPLLLDILAEELKVDKSAIVDFELNLFDCQPASLGGAKSEFVHSARLDNLASCFLALKGLVEHVHSPSGLSEDEDISVIALFDHEEVGSSSLTGAGSPIMAESVKRISSALNAGEGNPDLYASALARSFILSVDQAHAVHPNYASKHEKGHMPKMNQGMVIKRNSNQRYATNGITGLIVREIARRAGLPPIQEFVVRNDCGCGSTIGPILSAATGIRAIDLGCPQLSMHSIRETMGVSDLTHALAIFRSFFQNFREVDSSIDQ